MPSFRVDCVKDIKGLAGYLEKCFESTEKGPAGIRMCCYDDSLVISVEGFLRKGGRRYQKILLRLSDTLAEYILKAYEKNILEKVIQKNCSDLQRKEQEEIFRIACARLYTPAENGYPSLLDSRRRLISSKIAENLNGTGNFFLDGFVTFRLWEYVKRLEKEVERSARQLFVERQYEEYIHLLSAFVRMQAPRVPELHVFVRSDGSYKMEGTGLFEIPEDVAQGFGMEKDDAVIRDDDFMIGFLLTLAPIRIFIHDATLFRNKELLNTIRIVFSECVLL